jgi:hypothetical protein
MKTHTLSTLVLIRAHHWAHICTVDISHLPCDTFISSHMTKLVYAFLRCRLYISPQILFDLIVLVIFYEENRWGELTKQIYFNIYVELYYVNIKWKPHRKCEEYWSTSHIYASSRICKYKFIEFSYVRILNFLRFIMGHEKEDDVTIKLNRFQYLCGI